MKPSETITLTLTRTQVQKLKMMQASISEPSSFEKILDGLLDVGYTSALKILYDDGQLNHQALKRAATRLPDYLRDALLFDTEGSQ